MFEAFRCRAIIDECARNPMLQARDASSSALVDEGGPGVSRSKWTGVVWFLSLCRVGTVSGVQQSRRALHLAMGLFWVQNMILNIRFTMKAR